MVSISLPTDDWTPWALDGAFACATPAPNGATYRLSLSIPPGDAPASGFPLLVVLDGDVLFATAVGMERRLARKPASTGVQATVILGIGHDKALTGDTDPRRRDFTYGPCRLDDEPATIGQVGGGPAFHDFIQDIALPLVRRAAPVDADNLGLFGHSLAGLFVLETLARHPAAYRAFIAVSPSLWWSSTETLAGLSALPPASADAVLILAGEHEAAVSERQQRRAMIATARRAGDILAASSAARISRSEVIADADHASVVDQALRLALKMLSR